MKYLLVWKDTNTNKKTYIAKFNTRNDALDSISSWWNKHKFEPPYVRIHEFEENGIKKQSLDYGSHTMFYEIWEVEDNYKPVYATIWLECKTFSNGTKDYKIVDFEYDEALPGCSISETHVNICGITCKRDTWYTENHINHVTKNLEKKLIDAKPLIDTRESNALRNTPGLDVSNVVVEFTL